MSALPSKNHPFLPTRGLLFLGDPHVWSRQPGRRLDASFLDTVLGKIEWAANLANERQLQPLILGDLLHADRDQDTRMLVRLSRTLQKFDRKPVTLLGNHERDELQLTERNPLMLLKETGQLEVLAESGPWGVVTLTGENGENRRVLVAGTPYGLPIPHSAAFLAGLTEKATKEKILKALGVDHIVWMTHEDLAFDGAYPGAQLIEPMIGVDVAVNGHMHGTSRPFKAGETVWYNPGNITRMSVDHMDHVPSVWEWHPWLQEQTPSIQGLNVTALQQHVIPHTQGSNIFILEGRRAQATAVQAPALEVVGSRFAAELALDRTQQRTDDAAFVRGTIAEDFAQHSPQQDVQRVVLSLLERSAEAPNG